jgi:hypothetical protein
MVREGRLETGAGDEEDEDERADSMNGKSCS